MLADLDASRFDLSFDAFSVFSKLSRSASDGLRAEEWALLAMAGCRLCDAGWGGAVRQGANTVLARSKQSAAVKTASVLLACCELASGSALKAESYCAAVFDDTDEAGSDGLDTFIRFWHARALHRMGDYAFAAETYLLLDAREPDDLIGEETRLLAKRQLADIWILKGRFKDAVSMLTACLSVRREDRLWQLECHRMMGHALRFNFQLEDAYRLYEAACKDAEAAGLPRMEAKLVTNCAEALCLHDPSFAESCASEALGLNGGQGSSVESAKAFVARGIARSMLGASGAGADFARAMELNKRTGYKAGNVFVHFGRVVESVVNNDPSAAQLHLGRLRDLTGTLGVYQFLVSVAELMAGERSSLESDGAYQWFSPERVASACDWKSRADVA